jgi:hypothetical protein
MRGPLLRQGAALDTARLRSGHAVRAPGRSEAVAHLVVLDDRAAEVVVPVDGVSARAGGPEVEHHFRRSFFASAKMSSSSALRASSARRSTTLGGQRRRDPPADLKRSRGRAEPHGGVRDADHAMSVGVVDCPKACLEDRSDDVGPDRDRAGASLRHQRRPDLRPREVEVVAGAADVLLGEEQVVLDRFDGEVHEESFRCGGMGAAPAPGPRTVGGRGRFGVRSSAAGRGCRGSPSRPRCPSPTGR